MNNVHSAIYLLFQLFTADPASVVDLMPQADIDRSVNDLSVRIGTTGDKRHKLGFVVGPISFNHSDDEVKRLIVQSFEIARRRNMAVAFHIDDSMFWDKRKDLIQNKENVEWINWNGGFSTGRRLDWGPKPTKVAPQMCFNSPAIKLAVSKRAELIGTEIKHQIEKLNQEGKQELFAGVIAGWETQLGRDFDSNRSTGYHALFNKGLRSTSSNVHNDQARVEIVQSFIELWARSLNNAGIPVGKIYSHIAFTSQGIDGASAPAGAPSSSYAQQVNFAEPSVSFGKSYLPGFSTYPEEGAIEQICKQVAIHGNPTWISAEGTNVVPSGMKGEATMETYLAKMFNHGAVAINIFSWGMGGEAQKENFFRKATENPEALGAYRKFLEGRPLLEQSRPASQFSPRRLQEKIRIIQAQAPVFMQNAANQDLRFRFQSLMQRLDSAIKNNRFEDADSISTEVILLLEKK